MLIWPAYLVMILAIISGSALAVERIGRSYGFETRWTWAAALAVSLTLPLALSSMLKRPAMVVTTSASQ
jgi:hypothetical protein